MKQTAMERFAGWGEIACDLVLLNLLWLACCLPVVTVGASTTAMHYCVRKMVSGEPYGVWRSFWSSFRANWKQATGIWLLLLACGLICGADIAVGPRFDGWMGTACQIVGVLGLIVLLCALMLVFPLLARYTQGTLSLLKSAVVLSFTNPHVVLAGYAAAALFPALALLNARLLIIATPGWLLLGGGLTALVVQLLLRPVYARLEKPASADKPNPDGSDTETERP